MTQDQFTLQYRQRRTSRRRAWRGLEIILFLAFVLCLALGAGALYFLWSLTNQPAISINDSPLKTLTDTDLVPSLALRQLSGDPSEALASQALQAGELPTTQTLLLFDIHTPPVRHVALALELAEQWIALEKFQNAALVAKVAQIIATLDVRMSPLERAQSISLAAERYSAAGETAAARSTVIQALTLAAQTPALLPAQRSQIFSALLPIARQLDEPALLQRVDDYVRNPFVNPTGVLITPTLFTLAAPVVLDPAVIEAQTIRQAAARRLADRILLTQGVDIAPEQEELSNALLNEDRLRTETSPRVKIEEISLQQQFGLLLEERNWLVIKLQIAKKGYGLSILPQWEAGLDTIQQELAENANALSQIFDALISVQPTPAQQAALRTEAMWWLAQQQQLGIYANYPLEDLRERIRFAQAEAERLLGPLALPILYVEAGDGQQIAGFVIQAR
jgi:hypothetical protein